MNTLKAKPEHWFNCKEFENITAASVYMAHGFRAGLLIRRPYEGPLQHVQFEYQVHQEPTPVETASEETPPAESIDLANATIKIKKNKKMLLRGAKFTIDGIIGDLLPFNRGAYVLFHNASLEEDVDVKMSSEVLLHSRIVRELTTGKEKLTKLRRLQNIVKGDKIRLEGVILSGSVNGEAVVAFNGGKETFIVSADDPIVLEDTKEDIKSAVESRNFPKNITIPPVYYPGGRIYGGMRSSVEGTLNESERLGYNSAESIAINTTENTEDKPVTTFSYPDLNKPVYMKMKSGMDPTLHQLLGYNVRVEFIGSGHSADKAIVQLPTGVCVECDFYELHNMPEEIAYQNYLDKDGKLLDINKPLRLTDSKVKVRYVGSGSKFRYMNNGEATIIVQFSHLAIAEFQSKYLENIPEVEVDLNKPLRMIKNPGFKVLKVIGESINGNIVLEVVDTLSSLPSIVMSCNRALLENIDEDSPNQYTLGGHREEEEPIPVPNSAHREFNNAPLWKQGLFNHTGGLMQPIGTVGRNLDLSQHCTTGYGTEDRSKMQLVPIELFEKMNRLIASMDQIAKREGYKTDWDRLTKCICEIHADIGIATSRVLYTTLDLFVADE